MLDDGRRLYLLADGRLVNLVRRRGPSGARDGHVLREPGARRPSTRSRTPAQLERKVYAVPEEIDDEIARLKLATMGVDIDTLTEEQAQLPRLVGRRHLTTPTGLRRTGGRDEGDRPGSRVRDPAAAADGHVAEAAPAGRRAADARLDPATSSTRSDEVDELHVVTNAPLRAALRGVGAGGRASTVARRRHDLERRPPRRDRRHPLHARRGGLGGDDLLVVAGDNLFDFCAHGLRRFWRAKGEASAVARATTSPPRARARVRGRRARRGRPDRVASSRSPSGRVEHLAATATYVFHREHAALVDEYLDGATRPTSRDLPRLAPPAGARLRLPLRRRVARHRRPRAAPRGGQPRLPAQASPAGPSTPRTESAAARQRHPHIGVRSLPSAHGVTLPRSRGVDRCEIVPLRAR